MNILDIIVIVFLLFIALIGFCKGFVNSLISFFSSALSSVASFFLAKPLANLINNWFGVVPKLATSISNQIGGFFADFSNLTGSQIMAEKCSASGLLKVAINFFVKADTTYANKTDVVANVSNGAGSLILMAICLIVAYILIKLALILISKLFGKLKQHSNSISFIDRFLGMIFGILQGAVIVFAIFVVVNMLQSLPAVSNFLDTTFNNSSIAKPIYDFVNNIVSTYLSKINLQDGILSLIK